LVVGGDWAKVTFCYGIGIASGKVQVQYLAEAPPSIGQFLLIHHNAPLAISNDTTLRTG
jgi:hypothetical protein